MIETRWLGRTAYEEAWQLQLSTRSEILEGTEQEVVLATEHLPVITAGRRDAGLDEGLLAANGLSVLRTERGGLATYHGPGQLVLYPIVHIRRRGLSVRDWVFGIEQQVIDWIGGGGVSATRRCGQPGVWIGEEKVCAIGLHISRGISIHGLALNIHTDLMPYSLFTPCGIVDGGVTRLCDHGLSPSVREAALDLGGRLARWISKEKD